MLVVDHLTKRYITPAGEVEILREASLTAAPGDTVAIVGPSGSGKSTLLNLIGALDMPTDGSITFGETNVTALAGEALADYRARNVGFVFQEHHLLPQLTALENVLVPTLVLGGREDRTAQARELLERVGVAHRADAFPAQMSGGERQRVAVARALINGAGLLLCDEPTGNLDRDTGAGIVSLFLELAEQRAVTVLMVTHNLEQARRFARVLALCDGQLQPLEARA